MFQDDRDMTSGPASPEWKGETLNPHPPCPMNIRGGSRPEVDPKAGPIIPPTGGSGTVPVKQLIFHKTAQDVYNQNEWDCYEKGYEHNFTTPYSFNNGDIIAYAKKTIEKWGYRPISLDINTDKLTCAIYQPSNLKDSDDRTKYEQVNDSGERQEFETGAVRDIQSGKGRYDLIPGYALERLAKHYENGAKKYGDGNWELGIPIKRCLDSLLRHANKYKQGLNDEDHLSAVVWNAFTIIETEEKIRAGKLPSSLKE